MDIGRFARIPVLAEYVDGADHVDVKSGEGLRTLREFVASVLIYQPGWMRALMKVRGWLLMSLGQGKQVVSEKVCMTAESLPVEAGEKVRFFTVTDSDGETYWMAVGEESHLGAALCVVAEPVDGKPGVQQFHVITVVRYRNWVGPLYFNLIRPFHHLIVVAAMRTALGVNEPTAR